MLLPKKDRKLFSLLFILMIFLTGNSFRNLFPKDLQEIIFDSPDRNNNDIKGIQSDDIKPNDETTIITKVIDGDTIETSDNKKIRYIGIDAPESQDPRKTLECFATEAYEKNKQLVLGKTVRLEKDISETDRYGRLLRYVYVNDVLINEMLVKEGFALSTPYPPDIKYQQILDAAEISAKDNIKGLWSSCVNKN